MKTDNTKYTPEILKRSKDIHCHPECILTKKCQETEGFKGTEHEGVDMCEDGCVWFDPRTLKNG